MLKTKFGQLVSLVAVVVVLGLGYVYVIAPVSTNGHHKELVTARVSFIPARIPATDHGVKIVVLINNVPEKGIPRDRHSSPWAKMFEVPTGQAIVVTAQRDLLGSLKCQIFSRGKEVSKDEINLGGIVQCAHLLPI